MIVLSSPCCIRFTLLKLSLTFLITNFQLRRKKLNVSVKAWLLILADADTILPNINLAIGYPRQSVNNANLSNKLVLVPNWQILGYNSDIRKLKLANANFAIESISVPSFQPYHQISINIRFYRSPNIPVLVKNYFCWKSFFLCVCFSPYNWTLNVNTLKKCDFKTKFIKRAAS